MTRVCFWVVVLVGDWVVLKARNRWRNKSGFYIGGSGMATEADLRQEGSPGGNASRRESAIRGVVRCEGSAGKSWRGLRRLAKPFRTLCGRQKLVHQAAMPDGTITFTSRYGPWYWTCVTGRIATGKRSARLPRLVSFRSESVRNTCACPASSPPAKTATCRTQIDFP